MVVGEFTQETNLLVIGGGPGGYSAAFRAAQRGVQTTIVEATPFLGGECLHHGCIPSKTLLAVAEILGIAEHAKALGITFAAPQIDLDAVRSWKDQVIAKLAKGLDGLCSRYGVDRVRGRAQFEDSRHVAILDGEVARMQFRKAIIATGSRPAVLRGVQVDSPRVMDSKSALSLAEIPGHLLVIGGGYIGLEMGSVYAALGSEVTVVEMMDSLLPGADADLVRPLAKQLGRQFHQICLSTKVTRMIESKTGIQVAFEGKRVPDRELYEGVLVAVGRRPNTQELSLSNTSVELDDRGFIQVDERFRTADSRIYAVGDVVGEPMLAHHAIHQGYVCADVIAGRPAVFDVRAVPAVVFTDPEIAWCGLTEAQAKADDVPIRVQKVSWMASGRATAIGRTEGVTKIIFEPDTGRILGVGIAGPHAGEMIAEAVLAIEMGAVATDLADTIHAHPTLSETMGEAAALMVHDLEKTTEIVQ